MTDQEIMQLARDVGMAVREVGLSFTVVANGEEMQRFATFVAKREREACAELVENQRYAVLQEFRTYTADELVQSLKSDAKTLAKMIRSRGEKES